MQPCCIDKKLVYNYCELEGRLMEITVLASGSKGNAAFIKTDQTQLMIDCGISFRQIKLRMQEKAPLLTKLDAIILSHEHSDHTKGVFQTLKQTQAPLYTAKKTYQTLKQKIEVEHEFVPIEEDNPFMLGDLIITPLKTSHDALHSLGFMIQQDHKRLVYITDTGFLQESSFTKIKNADAYLIEANYDVAMLFDSPRPYYLKKRIDSVKGHLSNADSAYYLSQLIGDNTKSIILAHPSQECNTEKCALATVNDIFSAYDINAQDYNIFVAKQHTALTVKI